MTMVLPSPAPATLALIFIGPWLAIPGMPVMTRLAAENCGTSVSENFSSMVAGAETCDLSAGVEDTSEGCANAAVANRPAAIGATSLAMKCERVRSEEHTSELQSQSNLVCRLLLEKKKKKKPRATRQDKMT